MKIRIAKGDDRFLTDLREVTLGDIVGSGNFSTVYSGRFRGQVVAVKLICTDAKLTREEYSQFIKEGKLMLDLEQDEHLIKIHAMCISEEFPALIMDYADKGTLKNFLCTQEELPVDTLLSILIGMAQGVHALHRQDVIHRDIAARNFLLSYDLVPKLSDFGLSREVSVESNYNSTGKHPLPLKWMAPEALKCHVFTKMTDIWSFGITTWEVTTHGNDPHTSLPPLEATIQIRDNFLKPTIPPDAPASLQVVMQQCWYHDPDYRPCASDIIDIIKDSDR